MNQVSRKKFLSWSIGITSLLSIPAFFKFSKKKKPSRVVKMLTQDGQLVCIAVEDIPAEKKKVKTSEIQTWVNGEKKSL